MTQRYMHLSPAALYSAIRLLDEPVILQKFGDLGETGTVPEGEIKGWNNLTGGEAGIRTLDTAFRPYNGLANRRLQPLGHLTVLKLLRILRVPFGSTGHRGRTVPKTVPQPV